MFVALDLYINLCECVRFLLNFIKEREEESRRLKMQKISEEAEQKRLASEYEQRKNERIIKDIEERERQEAEEILNKTIKGAKKKGKKLILEGVSHGCILKLFVYMSQPT